MVDCPKDLRQERDLPDEDRNRKPLVVVEPKMMPIHEY